MIKDENIINKVIQLNGTMSQNNIAKELGISQPTVKSILLKNGIEPISFNNRKYNFNESFFEVIDTQEKAYFLGFIVADGFLHLNCSKEYAKKMNRNTQSKRISINISNNDVDLLYKFQECINLSANCVKVYEPIGTYSNHLMCKITLNSKKMFDDLVSHGLCAKKTGTEHIPNTVPNHLIKHFIRGFLDGDGTIAPRGKNKCTIGFCSFTSIILEQINDHLQLIGCTNRTIHFESKKKMYYLYYHSAFDLCKIYDYLYCDATVFLQRKKDKYLNTLLS